MTESNNGPYFLPAHLKLKGAENYASWKYYITDILGSKYLDEFILTPPGGRNSGPATRSITAAQDSGVDPATASRTPAQIWKANDFKAKSIITANILVEPSKLILKAKSALEA